jgi:glycosyltransferase involved in cell wall biosynthesis
VSTPIGCEGLDARDGQNILIREGGGAFADAVCDVLEHEQLRERLGAAARITAETSYDWERVGERMIEAYMTMAGATREWRPSSVATT